MGEKSKSWIYDGPSLVGAFRQMDGEYAAQEGNNGTNNNSDRIEMTNKEDVYPKVTAKRKEPEKEKDWTDAKNVSVIPCPFRVFWDTVYA